MPFGHLPMLCERPCRLVARRRHTTPKYETVFSMAVYVISMQHCNNLNPYNDCIIPKDQLECLLAGSRPTEFDLSTKVITAIG